MIILKALYERAREPGSRLTLDYQPFGSRGEANIQFLNMTLPKLRSRSAETLFIFLKILILSDRITRFFAMVASTMKTRLSTLEMSL